jgi:hypothetical protein
MLRKLTVLEDQVRVIINERHAPLRHAAPPLWPAQLHLQPRVTRRGGVGGDGGGGGRGAAGVRHVPRVLGAATRPAAGEEEAPAAGEEADPRLSGGLLG